MIRESRAKYIGVAYRREERREVQVYMVGLLKIVIQQQYVRGTRWFGDYCCCCRSSSSPAILPAGTRIICTWHVIRSSWISRPPDRSFAFSLQYIQPPSTVAPPHTCNTMNWFNTTLYPAAVICRCYGLSQQHSMKNRRAVGLLNPMRDKN